MFILVYVRTRIDPVAQTGISLAGLESPQYVMSLNTDGTIDETTTNSTNEDMLGYFYYDLFHNETYPASSPLTFNPGNCL
jgi:hypothetical protein